MKVKLLKKLRRKGMKQIDILSVTREYSFGGSCIVGMSYSYTGEEYSGLFSIGNTEDDVRCKAMKIYINKYLKSKGRAK